MLRAKDQFFIRSSGVPREIPPLGKGRRIPAVALLAQAFLSYPDPGAAASALLALSKILKVKFDVQPLLEKGDEIRLKARDLMKQAQGAISGMQKGTEQEIPLMYR